MAIAPDHTTDLNKNPRTHQSQIPCSISLSWAENVFDGYVKQLCRATTAISPSENSKEGTRKCAQG